MIVPSRRRFLFGAGALLAAPAIVRVSALMPVKPFIVLPESPSTYLGIYFGRGVPTFSAVVGALFMRSDADGVFVNTDGRMEWTRIVSQSA